MNRPLGACWLFILVWLGGAGAALAAGPPGPLVSPQEPISVPGFELVDLSGASHRLAAYRGRVVVVNFWATWCAPCVHEMPALNRAAAALAGDKVVFLGINIGEEPEAIKGFIERVPVDFPILLDSDQSVVGAWPIIGLPTTVIISTAGRVAYRVAGVREWDDPGIVGQLRALSTGQR